METTFPARKEQREHDREVAELALAAAELKYQPEKPTGPTQQVVVYGEWTRSARHWTIGWNWFLWPLAGGDSTITALEVRRQKELELRENDLYWQKRLHQQEESLRQTVAILASEYNKTVSQTSVSRGFLRDISSLYAFLHFGPLIRCSTKSFGNNSNKRLPTTSCRRAETTKRKSSIATKRTLANRWTVLVLWPTSRIVCSSIRINYSTKNTVNKRNQSEISSSPPRMKCIQKCRSRPLQFI